MESCMIKKINLKNFKIHKNSEIEFEQMLSILTGENYSTPKCQEIFTWEGFNLELPSAILTKFMGDSFENEKVYLFRNKNYDKNAPAHFHIALKTNQDEYLVLSMITSQVEKRIRYYTLTNKSLVKSVIIIDSNDIDILEKESCIDCNEPIYSTKVRDEIKNSLGEW